MTLLVLTLLGPARFADAQAARWPVPEWPRSTPEALGVDSEPLLQLFELANTEGVEIHHVAFIRRGHVFFDADFYPYDRDVPHDLASVTKSITSTLIGIAIDRGLIPGLDSPVLGFFPDVPLRDPEGRLQRLTLRHLLTMTSGFCRDFTDGERQLDAMRQSDDWVRFMLAQPLVDEPGGRFAYCSGTSHLLSAIVTRATGMNALTFARARLFDPLGIGEVIWPEDPQGNNTGWGDLHMRPLDLARIGYLFLQGGVWNGRRILSESWIREATVPQVFDDDTGYGFRWWIPGSPPGLYEGRGRGGQRLAVWPAGDLVAVIYGSGGFDPGQVGAILFPAMRSNDALPPNPAAYERLSAAAAAARQAPAPRPVAPLPAVAQMISGTEFVLDPNPLGLLAFTLWFDGSAEARLRLVQEDGPEENAVGLDGVYRMGPTSDFGLPEGLRGSWLSEREFLIDYNEAANNHLYRILIEFQPGAAVMQIREHTGLVDFAIRARPR